MSISTVNVQVIGRIGQDCTIRPVKEYFALSFSVAASEKRSDGNYVTTWFNFTYWSKSDKMKEYLTKGRLISVTSDWFDVTEKEGKHFFNFRVKELNPFLEKKEQTTTTQNPVNTSTQNDEEDDGLPF